MTCALTGDSWENHLINLKNTFEEIEKNSLVCNPKNASLGRVKLNFSASKFQLNEFRLVIVNLKLFKKQEIFQIVTNLILKF